MGFVNQDNCLICNSIGDILLFRVTEQGISMSYFDKALGKAHNEVVIKGSIEEYNVTIDKNDKIYLICQKKNKDILLLTYDNFEWNENIIADKFDSRLYNLNIVALNNTIHILYCVQSNNNENIFRISHHYLDKDTWITNDVKEITRKDILNPIHAICNEDEIFLGYYDLVGSFEELFIVKFNTKTKKWSNAIKLTSNHKKKLYIDMLITDDGCINILYSENMNDNLLIKYEKYKLLKDNYTKVCDNYLSNPGNCTHPTFVYNQGLLWSIWIEYEKIMSCFSDDYGLSWSLPYNWKEFNFMKFTRYRFVSNNTQINDKYELNNSFGLLGNEIRFIGFGDIKNAVQVPLKSKKKDGPLERKEVLNRNRIEIIDNKEEQELEKKIRMLNDYVNDLEEYIKKLEQKVKDMNQEINKENNKEILESINKIKSIEKRLDDIEAYVFRRRRRTGFPFNPRE